jgi:hypothetical protein
MDGAADEVQCGTDGRVLLRGHGHDLCFVASRWVEVRSFRA